MEVTLTPEDFRMVPRLLAMTPLPIPLMTPPVTRTYFMAWRNKLASLDYCLQHKIVFSDSLVVLLSPL